MAFPHDGKKFKKGQSGNPEGRPPLKPLIEQLKATGDPDEAFEEAIIQLKKLVKKGNIKAIEYFLDRFYGKSKESLDLTSKGDSIRVPTIVIPPLKEDSESETG